MDAGQRKKTLRMLSNGAYVLTSMRAVEAACGEKVRPLTVAQTPWQYGG